MLSRVADSCLWLSRYVERAESAARILDVNMQLILDFEDQISDLPQTPWKPVLAVLEQREAFEKREREITPEAVMEFLTFDRTNPNAIVSCVANARENARTVREQISIEMWEQINRTHLYLRDGGGRAAFEESPIDFYRHLVDLLHAFQGTTDATMIHGDGWDFIQLGKYLERADSTSRVLDIKYHLLLPGGARVGGHVDITQWMAVLRSCSAMEAYLKTNFGQVTASQVAEFLILHDEFPRAIRFCVNQLDAALHRISGCDGSHFSNDSERLCGSLRSRLNYTTIEEIFQSGLHEFLDRTQLELIKITNAFTQKYLLWKEE